MIAKNPLPETIFLSKFKQAKSKFEERLEKKNKIKNTTPQRKPKKESCKTPKPPQAPKVNKIDNYIFGSRVNVTKKYDRKSDEVSLNTHEGTPLQSIAGKPKEILQRIMASQSAPQPSTQPPPPTTSTQTENSHCDTSNSNELQGSFGEKIRYADKQLSAGTSLRNVGLCPVLNKHVKVGKGAPPEDHQTPPHTRQQDHPQRPVHNTHTHSQTVGLQGKLGTHTAPQPDLPLDKEDRSPQKPRKRSMFEELPAKSKIMSGDKPPTKVKVNLKCEDNFPEVGNDMKNIKVQNSVDFGIVSNMKFMFERKSRVEDTTSRFRRQQNISGRQPKQSGSEEDNIDNLVKAPDQILEHSSKLKCEAKRLELNLPKQLLSQERGNLGRSNGMHE